VGRGVGIQCTHIGYIRFYRRPASREGAPGILIHGPGPIVRESGPQAEATKIAVRLVRQSGISESCESVESARVNCWNTVESSSKPRGLIRNRRRLEELNTTSYHFGLRYWHRGGHGVELSRFEVFFFFFFGGLG
jgi:hypothetical protein